MRFKEWINKESAVGTSVLHGGVGESPNDSLNVNMPVRSKISTNDGSLPYSGDPIGENPDKIFGFNKNDKKNGKNRKSMHLHRKDRFPISTRNVSSIGFSG
jgi:hypothetical protein